jgi:hypothetical protein
MRIEVPGDWDMVHCYVRWFPQVHQATESLIGGVEQTTIAPPFEVPVRSAYLPGTGDLRNANIYELRVMAL